MARSSEPRIRFEPPKRVTIENVVILTILGLGCLYVFLVVVGVL